MNEEQVDPRVFATMCWAAAPAELSSAYPCPFGELSIDEPHQMADCAEILIRLRHTFIVGMNDPDVSARPPEFPGLLEGIERKLQHLNEVAGDALFIPVDLGDGRTALSSMAGYIVICEAECGETPSMFADKH